MIVVFRSVSQLFPRNPANCDVLHFRSYPQTVIDIALNIDGRSVHGESSEEGDGKEAGSQEN